MLVVVVRQELVVDAAVFLDVLLRVGSRLGDDGIVDRLAQPHERGGDSAVVPGPPRTGSKEPSGFWLAFRKS